jgi:hypothetical protein
MHYEPGFIFNPICKLAEHEFTLPIDKSLIKGWHQGVVFDFGREYYFDNPNDVDRLGDYIDRSLKSLETYYTRKFEHIYPLDVLEEKIRSEVNIIIEDYLWPVNYAPFFNAKVFNYVMDGLPDLSNDEEWIRDNHLIKRIGRKPGTSAEAIPSNLNRRKP